MNSDEVSEFFKKTEAHIIPCTIGCMLGYFLLPSISLISTLFAIPLSIIAATYLWGKWNDVQKNK